MPRYSQANRPLAVTTPLGDDVLLLTGFRGYEAISQLFNFELDLLAELESDIPFHRVVGESVTVEMLLANGEKRYLSGLVRRLTQGGRGDTFARAKAGGDTNFIGDPHPVSD